MNGHARFGHLHPRARDLHGAEQRRRARRSTTPRAAFNDRLARQPRAREQDERARRLLTAEIGTARGIDPPAADYWISEQIDAAIEAQANEPTDSASTRRRRRTDG